MSSRWKRVRAGHAVLAATVLGGGPAEPLDRTLHVFADPGTPQVAPVLTELRAAADGAAFDLRSLGSLGPGGEADAIVLFLLEDRAVLRAMKASGGAAPAALRPEGFSIRRSGRSGHQTLWVAGFDRAGLLYGGLELAEQIALYGRDGVRDTDQNPYMALRGTKFNLPLDVRTPTYSDPGDSAQLNLPEMWTFEFWKRYIDELARHRYNFVSLWNLHPFPSLVRVPEYPDIALDDVERSTSIRRKLYELSGRGFDDPEILRDLETVRVMDIDEKIAHWRRVMAYGRDRNVRFYVVTWNIYPYGTFGKHGITADFRNETTIDYYRASVRELFRTYPDLAGIGLTTGENMPGATFEEKERWAFRTYGQGVLDVLEEQPDRHITFIHRQHEAKATEISSTFAPLIARQNVDFVYSFKYAQAHAYSSTTQTFHPDFVADIAGKGRKTIWTLRNDDNYLFRWGAPDFVREFLANIPHEVSRGYYFGSDGYVWGRDLLGRGAASSRPLEVEKHWYSFLLWGRLGYDPGLGNDRLAAILGRRHPGVDGRRLLEALQDASMIYPLTTGFHWGALDFQWYVECSCSRNDEAGTSSGYHDVYTFITQGTHPGTDSISIPDFVAAEVAGAKVEGTSPLEVARRIEERADRALERVRSVHARGDLGLWLQVEDIRAMAYLGLHYAHKIRAATEIARHRATHAPDHRYRAIDHARHAALYWRTYVSYLSAACRTPIWFNRLGEVDWKLFYRDALHDVRSLGGSLDIPSMETTPEGTLLEAEDGRSDAERSSRRGGFTGTGYLVFSEYRLGDRYVEWTYDAPAEGLYVLEVRYRAGSLEAKDARVVIDGEEAAKIGLWGTGEGDNWCWDRTTVGLTKGRHSVRLYPGGEFDVDHLGVISIP